MFDMRRKRKGLEEGKIVKEISNIWIEAGTEEDFASFPTFLYFSLYQRSFGVYTQQQYQMRSVTWVLAKCPDFPSFLSGSAIAALFLSFGLSTINFSSVL